MSVKFKLIYLEWNLGFYVMFGGRGIFFFFLDVNKDMISEVLVVIIIMREVSVELKRSYGGGRVWEKIDILFVVLIRSRIFGVN